MKSRIQTQASINILTIRHRSSISNLSSTRHSSTSSLTANMKRKFDDDSNDQVAKIPRLSNGYASQATEDVSCFVDFELRAVVDNFIRIYESLDDTTRTDTKPNYSYTEMIYLAMLRSPNFCLPIPEIYKYIMTKFPFFCTTRKGHWKNAVRHSLSKTKCFSKIAVGRGTCMATALQRSSFLWCIVPSSIINFARGDYRSNVDKESGTNTLRWGYYQMNAGQFWERVARIMESKLLNFRNKFNTSSANTLMESQVCNIQCRTHSQNMHVRTLPTTRPPTYWNAAMHPTYTGYDYQETCVTVNSAVSPTPPTSSTPEPVADFPSIVSSSTLHTSSKIIRTTSPAPTHDVITASPVPTHHVMTTPQGSPQTVQYWHSPVYSYANSITPVSTTNSPSLSASSYSYSTCTDSGNETFSECSTEDSFKYTYNYSLCEDRLSPNTSHISNYYHAYSPCGSASDDQGVCSVDQYAAPASPSSELSDVKISNDSMCNNKTEIKDGELPCLDAFFRDIPSDPHTGYDFSYWFNGVTAPYGTSCNQSRSLPIDYHFGQFSANVVA